MFSLQGFFHNSGIVTIGVLLFLSFCMIVTFWIFIYRYLVLKKINDGEQKSLGAIMSNKAKVPNDILFKDQEKASKDMLLVWRGKVVKQTTAGLVFLSIIASISPFVGLFGTVVEILDAFARLGGSGQISFDVIAPIISQALVATAAGIFVAVPAYSCFLILKRKAFEINIAIQMQIDILSARI